MFHSPLRLSIFILLSISLLIFSCGKDEVLIHENLYVPGNSPKDYSGVSTILVENYVNKIYIDLIGQKPTYDQLQTDLNRLLDNNLNEETRVSVISDVMNNDTYYDRLFQIVSDLLLDGASYKEVEDMWIEAQFIRDLVYQTGDTLLGQVYDREVIKYENVLNAPEAFKNGEIDLSQYFARMCYNAIYDEINMGSDNFVISCFENFFKRLPTVEQQERGVKMVDGQPTTLLFKSGSTKTEFIDIMTYDNEFFEGRILDAYQTLLLRTPTSDELSNATGDFIQNYDYQEVQINIMKTDEYAGFE